MPVQFPAKRASAQATTRTLGLVELSVMAGRRWGEGAAESSRALSPPAECPANVALRRESAAVFVPRRSPGAGRLMAEDGRQMAGDGMVWVG